MIDRPYSKHEAELLLAAFRATDKAVRHIHKEEAVPGKPLWVIDCFEAGGVNHPQSGQPADCPPYRAGFDSLLQRGFLTYSMPQAMAEVYTLTDAGLTAARELEAKTGT